MENQIKRNIWLEKEVRVMLEVLRELNITKLIDGKKYKNSDIFKKVHEEMVNLGVTTKTPEQIKNKWKALKTAFNNTKKNNSQSGSQRVICEFYNELNEILGDRPAYAIDGIDSQGDQESQNSNDMTENYNQAVDIEIEVDPCITQEDLNGSVTQVSAEEVKYDEPRKEIRESRKRKYGQSLKSKDEIQFQHQREILKEFFENQKAIEERAAKQRTADLKLVLNTFTKTMENIMKSQMPMMPYSYMPFGSASSSFQNRLTPPRSSSSQNRLSPTRSSYSQNRSSPTSASKKSDDHNFSDDSD